MSKTSTLADLNALAEQGGGSDRVAKHREAGRMTARERIEALLDPGSFIELDKFKTHDSDDFGMAAKRHLGDGVVTGYGSVEGRQIFVYAQDFTVVGGTISKAHGEKICKVMDLAKQVGSPIVALIDSVGARIQEGIGALAGYGDVLLRNMQASGVVPQIACIFGPCVGGAAMSVGLADVVLMVQGQGAVFITGPEVVHSTTNEDVTKDMLGGARIHSETSGVAHFVVPDDEACLERLRDILMYLPSNNAEDPPRLDEEISDRLDLSSIIPDLPSRSYDVKDVVNAIVDETSFLELHEAFAKNMVTGFARIGGRTIGVIANQPQVLAGCIDVHAAQKAARFVRTCDCFNIPLLTLVDAPGFLPGVTQEHHGIVLDAAKLLYAFAEATVPKVSLILRKAYGAAYVVMSSKHIKGDVNFALPTAEIAVMPPESAITVVYKDKLAAAPGDAKKLANAYREEFANPLRAAERGFVDEVLAPDQARSRIARAFDMLRDKRVSSPPRKHGNIPL
jgi:propionyl-CoA carboxylase beta chain